MSHSSASILVIGALAVAAGCEQLDQRLPFEPDPLFVAQRTVGPEGGLVSHPIGVALEFPRGALSEPATVTITPVVDGSAFPGSPEGTLIRGTYVRVQPALLPLAQPVRVDLAVDPAQLDEDDLTRLALATEDPDGGVVTEGVSFDVSAGILHGRTERLGAIAAILAANVVPVIAQDPPTLGGGTFTEAGAGGAPQRNTSTGVFRVRCGHRGLVRRCVDSGTIEVWASAEIRDRLSGDLIFLNPDVTGELEFTDFDSGVPTRVRGTVSATGTLRVRLGQAVTSFTVDDVFSTSGAGGASALTVQGNTLTFHQTTVGARTVEYELRPVGTGQQLVVRGQKSVDFENDDGTTTTATLFLDLRLRR